MSAELEKENIKQQWQEIAEKLAPYSSFGKVDVDIKTAGIGDAHAPTDIVLLRDVSELGKELLNTAMARARVLRYKNGPPGLRGETGDELEQYKYHRAILNRRVVGIRDSDFHVAAIDAAPVLDIIKTTLDELIGKYPAPDRSAAFLVKASGNASVEAAGAGLIASLREHIPETGEHADPAFLRNRANAIAAVAIKSGVTPAILQSAMQRIAQEINSQDRDGAWIAR